MSWAGAQLGGGSARVGVPMQLAKCLGIEDGEVVTATPLPGAAATKMVCVEPVSSDDWEVLELNASYVESRMLDQISVLTNGETFPFWIRGSQLVFLRTGSDGPAKGFSKLAAGTTQVAIAPKKRRRVARTSSSGPTAALPSRRQLLRVQPMPSGSRAPACFDMQRAVTVSESTLRALGCRNGDLIVLKCVNKRRMDAGSGRSRNRSSQYSGIFQESSSGGGATGPAAAFQPISLESKDTAYLLTQSRARLLTTVVRVKVSVWVAPKHAVIPRLIREHFAIPLGSTVTIQPMSKRDATYSRRIREVLLMPVRWANGADSMSIFRGFAAKTEAEEWSNNVRRSFAAWVGSHERDVPIIDGTLVALSVPAGGNNGTEKLKTFSMRVNPPPGLIAPSMRHRGGAGVGVAGGLSVAVSANGMTGTGASSPRTDASLDSASTTPRPDQISQMQSLPAAPNAHPFQLGAAAGPASASTPSSSTGPESIPVRYYKLPLGLAMARGGENGDAGYDGSGSVGSSTSTRRARPTPKVSVSVDRPESTRTGLNEFITGGSISPLRCNSYDAVDSSPMFTSAFRDLVEDAPLDVAAPGDHNREQALLNELGGVKSVADALSTHVRALLIDRKNKSFAVRAGRASAAGVLVTGPEGCGKSALICAIARDFAMMNDPPPVGFSAPPPAYVAMIQCAELVNAKVSVVVSVLKGSLMAAVASAPGVLILDDIDKLVPAPDEQPSPANLRSQQICEGFLDAMATAAKLFPDNPVAILASARSRAAVRPDLLLGGALSTVFEIRPPNAAARAEILKSAIEKRGWAVAARGGRDGGGLDMKRVSYATEGYRAQDLVHLADRAVHAAGLRAVASSRLSRARVESDAVIKSEEKKQGMGIRVEDADKSLNNGESVKTQEQSTDDEDTEEMVWFVQPQPTAASADGKHDETELRELSTSSNIQRFNGYSSILGGGVSTDAKRAMECVVTQPDMDSALSGFVPRALQGLNLHTSQTRWADIGGLKSVKDTIKETLEFPTRYAPLFARAPLKLRSGLMLYGPPGCGKTLLASAVSRECGLNFVSVKGPELLNKYIGASEQAVRDAFAKAEAAKPSVLFFDEFEAICPARGGDSTGVTDRVVNQMLCYLDGVEGRSEVYVLAASSRPDLVDPALLRPGRLDKSLFCGLPNEQERLEILTALSRKMNLGADVDLGSIAARTADYSGADLQGLLNDAQLIVINEALADVEPKGPPAGGGAVGVGAAAAEGKDAGFVMNGDEKKPNGGKTSEDRGASDHGVSVPQRCLEEALKNSSRSISKNDRERYDRIYSKFIKARQDRSEEKFGDGELRTTFA